MSTNRSLHTIFANPDEMISVSHNEWHDLIDNLSTPSSFTNVNYQDYTIISQSTVQAFTLFTPAQEQTTEKQDHPVKSFYNLRPRNK